MLKEENKGFFPKFLHRQHNKTNCISRAIYLGQGAVVFANGSLCRLESFQSSYAFKFLLF
jgi:hypothetical protein